MLEAYMWNQKGWAQLSKKTLYWRLVAYPAFRHASIIHALTPREADSLKSYFPGQCIEMIPNGLDLGEIDRLLSNVSNSASEINPYFLFVGRIHPKKGLHLLIEAFSRLSSHHVKLLIAGPVQDHTLKYAQELEANVKRYNLQDRVKFLGSVQGEQKWRLFREAWAFCLPSYSEGLATVNLEAAAAQTPVITTPESGVVESWSNHGGVFCSPDVEAVTAALEQALSWTITERNERGAQLRKLIENHYSWEAIIPQWLSIYQDLSEHNG
jgi:glycosyltransferase involved in cell wall biosynthesis